MSIGLQVGDQRYAIGTPSFLKAFFSTIVSRLEAGRWGSRYPTVMNKLYMGEVSASDVPKLRDELSDIREQLKQFSPDLVVWDFENPAKQPPWGSKIHSGIRSLSNYFWTSDGKELFEVFLQAIDTATATGSAIVIAG